ncbi:MAG: 2Fe-2S iron-sulfur cluster-binding protein [Anderseniella sp.]
MGLVNVVDHEGRAHELEVVEGWRVMGIIREHGLPMEGLCGGACACATCHLYVDDDWQAKLHQPRDDEDAMLDEVDELVSAHPVLPIAGTLIEQLPELAGTGSWQ